MNAQDRMIEELRHDRENNGLNLGEIFQKLKELSPDFDNVEITALDSPIIDITVCRGRYSNLCLCVEKSDKQEDFAKPLTVKSLRDSLEQILNGKTLCSRKNGEISYTEASAVWVSGENCIDNFFITDLVFDKLTENDLRLDNEESCPDFVGFVGFTVAHIPFFVESVKFQRKVNEYIKANFVKG